MALTKGTGQVIFGLMTLASEVSSMGINVCAEQVRSCLKWRWHKMVNQWNMYIIVRLVHPGELQLQERQLALFCVMKHLRIAGIPITLGMSRIICMYVRCVKLENTDWVVGTNVRNATACIRRPMRMDPAVFA